MDTEITMTQGDAAPARQWNFQRQDGSIPDLTGATVDFLIFRPDTKVQTNSGHTSCMIVGNPQQGQAQYQWQTSDLPIEGVYRCLLRITYASGKPETVVVVITVESDSPY